MAFPHEGEEMKTLSLFADQEETKEETLEEFQGNGIIESELSLETSVKEAVSPAGLELVVGEETVGTAEQEVELPTNNVCLPCTSAPTMTDWGSLFDRFKPNLIPTPQEDTEEYHSDVSMQSGSNPPSEKHFPVKTKKSEKKKESKAILKSPRKSEEENVGKSSSNQQEEREAILDSIRTQMNRLKTISDDTSSSLFVIEDTGGGQGSSVSKAAEHVMYFGFGFLEERLKKHQVLIPNGVTMTTMNRKGNNKKTEAKDYGIAKHQSTEDNGEINKNKKSTVKSTIVKRKSKDLHPVTPSKKARTFSKEDKKMKSKKNKGSRKLKTSSTEEETDTEPTSPKLLKKGAGKKKSVKNGNLNIRVSTWEPTVHVEKLEDQNVTKKKNRTENSPVPALGGTEISIEVDQYYAVDFVTRFYIGRVIKPADKEGNVLIKFLHKMVSNCKEVFTWPRKDDIYEAHQDLIFYGPIRLEGCGEFSVPDLDKINKKFEAIQLAFKGIK